MEYIYKWILNDTLDISTAFSYNVIFNSSGEEFNQIASTNRNGIMFLEYNEGNSGIMPYNSTAKWLDTSYKTISFKEQPTGDLLTWLNANGTQQPVTISGVYKLNATLTGIVTTPEIETNVTFFSKGIKYISMKNGGGYLSYQDEEKNYIDVYNNNTSTWIEENYEIVDFGEEPQEVTTTFLQWIIDNSQASKNYILTANNKLVSLVSSSAFTGKHKVGRVYINKIPYDIDVFDIKMGTYVGEVGTPTISNTVDYLITFTSGGGNYDKLNIDNSSGASIITYINTSTGEQDIVYHDGAWASTALQTINITMGLETVDADYKLEIFDSIYKYQL